MNKYVLAFLGVLFLISCSSTSHIQSVPIETIKQVIRTDTVCLNTFRFDSTYIYHSQLTDRSKDTLLIKETNTEIRYKILHDTIERVKLEVIHDSIPYEVRIIETKEVRKPPNFFDYLCYLSFGILIGITGWKVTNIIPSRH